MDFDENNEFEEGFEAETTATQTKVQPGPFGPFYLQELVNSGGMADIWIATDSSGRTIALRRLQDRLKFNFLARKRFVRGCEVLAKVHQHQSVIGYLDHGRINGSLYLTMEYVESSNLKLLFARMDPVLTDNVGNILIDMASALEHVHDQGYMHLDFKPENIIVTRNGSLRLVDFDLAQPIPEKPKKMSKNPGTPVYMAPEQLQREAFDHRVDIFSFGVSAYELLTGEKPFGNGSAQELLTQQLKGQVTSPHTLNPDIPAALEAVILKCLQAEPNRRYPFMSVLSRDLQAALYV